MIQSFSIENFASIKDKVTLSFEATSDDKLEDYYIIKPNEKTRLLKLGMIYGANASGKSNVLYALDFLRKLVLQPLNNKYNKIEYNPFLFCHDWKESPSKFELVFYSNGIKYEYLLEFNQQCVIYEELFYFNPNKALVFQRNSDKEKQFTLIEFGSKIKIQKQTKTFLEANTLWNNTVFGGAIKTNFNSSEINSVLNWFRFELMAAIHPNIDLQEFTIFQLNNEHINKNQIIEILKKADLNISDFEIKKNTNPILNERIPIGLRNQILENLELTEIIFNHNIQDKSYVLPYELQSLGTQRYFQLSGVLALLLNNSAILPIDEIESSLHPDLLRHFLLLFLQNSKGSQLICTTHFREFLQEKDLYRNDVIWFTEKNEKGATELFSLADFKSDVIRETSSVFNAYKIGKLGAVPNLSNAYIDSHEQEQ